MGYSEDRHIKEAFEKAEYKKLSELLKRADPKSLEAEFYRGVMAENGLQGKIDKKAAQKHYVKAFADGKGSLKAGTALARIYQKEGDLDDAEEIYAKVLSQANSEDKTSIAYASYRLARINFEKESDFVTAGKQYDQAIEIYARLAPNSKSHAKALYHRGQLALRQNDITKAKECFQNSKDMGYKLAKAEIYNIEARDLYANKAIEKYDEALRIDPNNINVKLGKAKQIEINSGDIINPIEYDKSLKLVREALVQNPKHPEALKYRAELQRKLSRVIAKDIIVNLIDRTADLDKATPSSWIDAFGGLGSSDHSEKRIEQLNILGVTIVDLLNKNDYFRDHALFNNESDIAIEITNQILISSQATIKKIAQGGETIDLVAQLKREAASSIEAYVQSKQPKTTEVNISAEDAASIRTRELFEAQVGNKLYDLYYGLYLATDRDSNVELKIEYDMLENGLGLAGKALPLAAAFLGPFGGGIWAGLGSGAAQVTKEQIHEWKKEAAVKAAKEFCKIGNRNPKVAEEYFKKVAKELVNVYGMQIDQLDEKGVDQLSNTAVERMLCHINSKASYGIINNISKTTSAIGKNVKTFLRNPGPAAARSIAMFLTGETTKKKNSYELLLEGAMQGRSTRKQVITTNARDTENLPIEWDADDVFTKPAITNNGRDIYCNRASDPDRYGVRRELIIPDTHKEDEGTKVMPILRQRLGNDFKDHQRKLDLQHYNTPQKKRAHQREEEAITRQDFAKKNHDYGLQEKIGWLGVFMGSCSLFFSHMIGTAALLGLPAASAIPFAVAMGITSAALPPVAVAFAAIGVGIFIKGTMDAYQGAQKKEKLLATRIEITEGKPEPKKESSAAEKQKQRETKFTERVKKKTRYTTHAEKEKRTSTIPSISATIKAKKMGSLWRTAAVERKAERDSAKNSKGGG
jgi:tetratricopeptide (TPR) repeat protein